MKILEWVYVGAIVGMLLGCCIIPFPRAPKKYADNSVQSIYVRGDRWQIQFGRQDTVLDTLNLYALTDCKDKVIIVRNSLTYGNQRDTVLHELLHAGTCSEDGQVHNLYYNSSTEEAHEGIYKIADYMTSLLHDNPEFARYLAGN